LTDRAISLFIPYYREVVMARIDFELSGGGDGLQVR
jgi:hypothetical protein